MNKLASLTTSFMLLLAACGGGGDATQSTQTTQQQPGPPVTRTIGSAGGTIDGPGGIVLTIPPGALETDTAITVAVDAGGAPPLPGDGRTIGPLYTVTPHATTFGVPITISVPFDAAQAPAGETVSLLKTSGDVWHQLVTERDGDRLVAGATSLSVIAVRCCIQSGIEIVEQPADQTAFEGGFAFFRVSAQVFGPQNPQTPLLPYQWFRNGFPMPGETNPTLLIPRVTLAHDNSLYMARVGGRIFRDSRAARLLVTPAAPPVVSAPPANLAPAVALTRVLGGNQHSVALAADGTLRAWGVNGDGQLGDGSFAARGDAVGVSGLADVATFAVGDDHAIALRANGEVWTWGSNDRSQLGDGSTMARSTPQRVAIGSARAAAANLFGMSRTSVVLADGTLWSWGSNLHGQLGDGTTTNRSQPVRAGTLSDVASVAAGVGFTLALRSDGTLWTWGDNRGGQLGDGSTAASLVPIPAPMPAPIVAVAAGASTSFALSNEGQVLAWGLNAAGEIGDGTRERRLVPTAVSLPAPAIAIAAGGNHALALLQGGRVYAWGWNADGQCGSGSADEHQTTPRPVAAPLPADIVAIGAGLNHSLAMARDGSVWAWGNNFSGQLNDGTSANERALPVMVRNLNLN